jgi:DHA3 family tetracycline resistance protein-like MFS transporter
VYGFILAAFGIGSAIGALAVSTGWLPRRYLTAMMAMWGAGSVPLALVGWTSSFPVTVLATLSSVSPTGPPA